jgi:hypothetical protein
MAIMRLRRALLLLGLAALAPSACVPAGGAFSPPPAGEALLTSVPPEAQPTSPPEATAGVDISSFVACEIDTPQEVADLIGGSVFRELEQEPSPACIYEVAAGPDGYAQFIVSIQPPDIAEASIAAMPEELGQPVAGMGDAAYLDYDEGADTYSLLVLVRGRFAMNVGGEGEGWTLAIGELFLSRLLGP